LASKGVLATGADLEERGREGDDERDGGDDFMDGLGDFSWPQRGTKSTKGFGRSNRDALIRANFVPRPVFSLLCFLCLFVAKNQPFKL